MVTKKAPAKAPAKKAPAKPAVASNKVTTELPVTDHVVPVEADDLDWRKPQRPTETTVQITSQCVLMLAWDTSRSTDYSSPIDRDFQPFDTIEDAREYHKIQKDWARSDVKEFGDYNHVIILCSDTAAMTFDSVDCFSKDKDWSSGFASFLTETPGVVFSIRRARGTSAANTELPSTSKGKAVKKAAPDAPRKPIKNAGAVLGKAAKKAVPVAASARVEDLNKRLAEGKERRAKLAEKAANAAPVAEPDNARKPRRAAEAKALASAFVKA